MMIFVIDFEKFGVVVQLQILLKEDPKIQQPFFFFVKVNNKRKKNETKIIKKK
jgi:hypothetical protein